MASLNIFHLYQIGIPFTYIKCVIIVETYFGTDDRIQSLYIYIPEKEVATHSSILAWETLWTKEPGGLLSMGSQRVGHC